jgi:hypothetical protein
MTIELENVPTPDALQEIALWDSKRTEAKTQLDSAVIAYWGARADKNLWRCYAGQFLHYWRATFFNWQFHVADSYAGALRSAFYKEFGFGP